MRRIRGIGVAAAVLALGLGTAWALGTAGTFDTNFDADGVVNGGSLEYLEAVVLSDGSVLALAQVWDGGLGAFLLEKRTPSGTLDAGFGGGDGVVDVGFGYPGYGARIDALEVAPDGRIFVSGYVSDRVEVAGKGKKTKTVEVHSGRVSAFTSVGILDTNFGTDGSFENGGSRIKAVIPVGTAAAYDLVLAYEETVSVTTPATGKGKKNQATSTVSRATVLHMIDDAGVDVTSFGVDGRVVEDLSPDHEDLLNSIAVDSQGRIAVVIAQYEKVDGNNPLTGVLLSRYSAVGQLDTGFGTSGRVLITNLGIVTGIAIDANDAIVVAAHHDVSVVAGVYHNLPDVVRYDVDGEFEVAFDVPEMPDTTNPLELDTWTNDVVVDSAGRVVVGVWYGLTNWDFTVVRCLANGTRDTSFGSNGIATPFDGYDRDSLFGLALGADDNIVAVGKQVLSTTTVSDFGVIVRWLGD